MTKKYISNPAFLENLIKKISNEQEGQFIPDVTVEKTILSDDILKELSTDEVEVLTASICNYKKNDYTSSYIKGFIKIKTPIIAETENMYVSTNYLQFNFNILNCNKIFNTTSYINPFYFPTKEERVEDLDNAMKANITMEHTIWGQNGVYSWMPTKSLSGEDLVRRLFEKNMKAVSQKHKFGQQARKRFSEWERKE